MTNYEKNKKLLDLYAAADVDWGVDKYGKIFDCTNSCPVDCIFRIDTCRQDRLKWLQQEYKEPKVDWSKVEVDTPILVRNFMDDGWEIRYFAGIIGGKVHTFDKDEVSDDYTKILPWRYAKLVEQEVEVPTANALEIPDDATNGDVIKAIFQDATIDTEKYICAIEMNLPNHTRLFSKDWWNTPYKER